MPPTLAETMDAFRTGFDHGRDKALAHVDSAIEMCRMAMEDTNADPQGGPRLAIRLSTLRQLRLAIATIRPDIAGQ